jgi:hypothetical protein
MGKRHIKPDFKPTAPFPPETEKELDPSDGKPVQVNHMHDAALQAIANATVEYQPMFTIRAQCNTF